MKVVTIAKVGDGMTDGMDRLASRTAGANAHCPCVLSCHRLSVQASVSATIAPWAAVIRT